MWHRKWKENSLAIITIILQLAAFAELMYTDIGHEMMLKTRFI